MTSSAHLPFTLARRGARLVPGSSGAAPRSLEGCADSEPESASARAGWYGCVGERQPWHCTHTDLAHSRQWCRRRPSFVNGVAHVWHADASCHGKSLRFLPPAATNACKCCTTACTEALRCRCDAARICWNSDVRLRVTPGGCLARVSASTHSSASRSDVADRRYVCGHRCRRHTQQPVRATAKQ